MNQEPFDFSIQDLNPKFLFSCLVERNTEEKNYHSHDFIELAIIMKGSSLFCINGIPEHCIKVYLLLLQIQLVVWNAIWDLLKSNIEIVSKIRFLFSMVKIKFCI